VEKEQIVEDFSSHFLKEQLQNSNTHPAQEKQKNNTNLAPFDDGQCCR
jgi:hypothetical protein